KYPHKLNQVVTCWQWGGPFKEVRRLTKTIFVNEALRVQASPRNHSTMSPPLIRRSFSDRNTDSL
ncbi:277_t:CDS:1, partial [Funneliformis geosporum]